jgi:hypothetical protein
VIGDLVGEGRRRRTIDPATELTGLRAQSLLSLRGEAAQEAGIAHELVALRVECLLQNGEVRVVSQQLPDA